MSWNFYGRMSNEKPFWVDDEIINLINSNSHHHNVISFHTWGGIINRKKN